MKIDSPRVSIGLPVYNGARYLAQALDALLAQTYPHLEIIISDNASNDNTQAICSTYTSRDPRVRYVRNRENLGAAPNYNQAFALSRGEYFKWAAHDDLCAPTYLEECIAVLDAQPDVVVCHSRTGIIDGDGARQGLYDDALDLRHPQAHARFRHYLFRRAAEWNAIFGVMRSRVLRQTPLIGSYIASDQVLLGELVLRGQVAQVPRELFWRRDHAHNSWRAHPSHAARALWFDRANAGRPQAPVTWKHLYEYLAALRRAPLTPREWTLCHLYMARWLGKHLAWPLQRRWRLLGTSAAEG